MWWCVWGTSRHATVSMTDCQRKKETVLCSLLSWVSLQKTGLPAKSSPIAGTPSPLRLSPTLLITGLLSSPDPALQPSSHTRSCWRSTVTPPAPQPRRDRSSSEWLNQLLLNSANQRCLHSALLPAHPSALPLLHRSHPSTPRAWLSGQQHL